MSFKDEVMDKKNYATNILNLPATGAIVQAVGQTKGAIGYIGLAYETKEVKQLAYLMIKEKLLSHL
jgi:phosphate transport system substrate-binding protein